ncbi:MAG: phosphoribosylglycinamide formyltransferase [Oscillospiraceae bacterium]|nr:phosphoribosylglycinamide formyltransferase [Oscillospiraceae bacterium]
MLKAKIAVLVSGGGTNLQALIDAQGKVLNSGEITLVISNKEGAFALTRAANAGIKTAVVKKADGNFEERIAALIDENNIDFIILAGFMSILTEKFTNRYANRIINVHPSLIPSFCGEGYYGLRVHKEALAYGVKVTGATVHFVNEIPDGGEIIFQKAVEILDDDTPETLQKRVMEQAEWIILPLAAEKVANSIVRSREND